MAAGTTGTPGKILHVVLSLSVGGAEKLVYDLVRDSAFASEKPMVCCLDRVGELGERLRQEGYTVRCRGRRSGVDLGLVRWLREVIREEGVCVVHAHQYTPLFYAVPAALLAGGVQVVYTEHGRLHPDRRRWKRYLFNPLLSLGVRHIVSISESTAAAMARYDNFSRRAIKVVRNGVVFRGPEEGFDPLRKRSELGLDQHSSIVGTAARLEQIKNIPMMLRGFRSVLATRPESYLLIAGDGSQREALQHYAEELGIARRVVFLGLRFDLPELYRLFDIFLLTSFTEGISLTLLEAMSSGVPAVVTDVGGNREVVVDGETGFLVGNEDHQALAGRILQLLAERELSQEMGRKGARRAEREFSFDGMIRSYCALYAGASGPGGDGA